VALGVQVRVLEVVPLCTFKITNYPNILPIDTFLELGGPTLAKTHQEDDLSFTHYLLPITGEITPQPIIKDDMLYMLLGEVYNYNKLAYKSDIYTVIEQYLIHKDKFTNYLDGEFFIIIYDMKKKLINFYTDPWATKMCWFDTFSSYFYFGSFKLSKESVRLKHNSHYTFDFINKRLVCENNELHKWDLRQFKDSYNDWDTAFFEAVKKRHHKETVLALSGGVDSQAIAACLSDLKLNFEAITLSLSDCEDKNSIYSIKKYIQNSCENIYYLYSDYSLKKDSNSFKLLLDNKIEHYALSYVCAKMKVLRKRVLFTGSGADEIIDNYINKYKLKGKPFVSMTKWPEDLENNFPYDHFYENRQRKFIDIQQYVSLSYGIETRNPFLDKRLAQEWLWISPSLKNKESKGPIKNFLRSRDIYISEKILGLGDQNTKMRSDYDTMLS